MHWIWGLVSIATAGSVYARARTAANEIFLTFDDGPDPKHTPRLLELLSRHKVPATFFLVGSRAEEHGSVVRDIVAAGHALGNHSFNHPRFDRSSLRIQAEEISRTDALLSRYDGRARHPVRPPHGRATFGTILLCAWRRQRIALWNRDSLDFKLDSAAVVERFRIAPVKPGDILLFHDDSGISMDALGQLIPRWQESGLKFSTL
ncbi:MAG: polysaccharide deacetylase family protein [Pseudomonadota bacterium]